MTKAHLGALLAVAFLAACDEPTEETDTTSSSSGGTSSTSSSGGEGNCGTLTYYGFCDGDTLHYCNSGEPTEVDCSAGGRSCGLQNSVVGFNCLSSDCSDIPSGGHCPDSATFEYCTPSGAEQQDCSSFSSTCGELNGEVQCVSACGGITFQGECNGNTLRYCLAGADTEELIVSDCTESGLTCQLVNDEIGYNCVDPAGGCGGVPESGSCNGTTLQWCDGGELQQYDCASESGTCEVSGSGAQCVSSGGGGGTRTVSGTVSFEKFPVTSSGLGSGVGAPARRVRVEVLDGDTILAAGSTDDNGQYSISFDGDVAIRVRAITRQTDPQYRIDVHDPDGAAYAVSSATQSANGSLTVNLDITENEGSGAFNIFDLFVKGFDFVSTNLGQQAPALEGEWAPGVTPPCGTSCYSSRASRIYILSKSDDTDEFDDPVLLHEFGHYFEDKFSRSDSPGGSHDGSPTDPRLAWGEGYGTWVGAVISGSSLYIDTSPGGASVTDLEDSGRAPEPSPGSGLSQPIGEYLVAEILWDISDGSSDSGDSLSAGAQPIIGVLGNYFTGGSFADRGVEGVDLVDFLDGWFCRGNGQNEQIESIVVTTRGFPYDIGGGPSSCP